MPQIAEIRMQGWICEVCAKEYDELFDAEYCELKHKRDECKCEDHKKTYVFEHGLERVAYVCGYCERRFGTRDVSEVIMGMFPDLEKLFNKGKGGDA